MTQATTNTIRINLVSHLQTCMAVCAGSLQTLDLSVSLCYRCKKLRDSKRWQDWKLKGVSDQLTRSQGKIKMLEETSSQTEQLYSTHFENMKERLRSRREDAVSYRNEVREETRRCKEAHQSEVKALEERCFTAEQQVQAEVHKCTKLQACCAELEMQVEKVRRPMQTCVPSYFLLLLFTDLVQTWVKGLLHGQIFPPSSPS